MGVSYPPSMFGDKLSNIHPESFFDLLTQWDLNVRYIPVKPLEYMLQWNIYIFFNCTAGENFFDGINF